MKTIAILTILFSSIFSYAGPNPYVYRKYSCVADMQGTTYLADIYHEGGGEWGEPKNGKGIIMLTTNRENSLPMLLQDVSMKLEKNQNGLPCNFIADFDLQYETLIHSNLNIDTCSLKNWVVKGIATISGKDSLGNPKKYQKEISCKLL